MKYIYILPLVVLFFILMSKREMFGFAGYTKPIENVKLDDPRPDLSDYDESEASIDNDMMEAFVLQANKEISKRTGANTYIIETTAIKKYVYTGEDSGKGTIYECMFMVVKNGGFSFGFSTVASFEVFGSKPPTLISLRSQPMGVQVPVNVGPFVNDTEGKEFIEYNLVKETAVPSKGELDSAKNKLQ